MRSSSAFQTACGALVAGPALGLSLPPEVDKHRLLMEGNAACAEFADISGNTDAGLQHYLRAAQSGRAFVDGLEKVLDPPSEQLAFMRENGLIDVAVGQIIAEAAEEADRAMAYEKLDLEYDARARAHYRSHNCEDLLP